MDQNKRLSSRLATTALSETTKPADAVTALMRGSAEILQASLGAQGAAAIMAEILTEMRLALATQHLPAEPTRH